MTNIRIAALFDELADIMEIAGENHFKIRAYRNASKTIGGLEEDLGDISPDKIDELPGIGKAITGKIQAAVSTGTFPTLEKWRQSGFASLQPLLSIKGLTIRKLRAVMKELKIQSMADLKTAIRNGTFETSEGLDDKLKNEMIHFVEKIR